MRPAASQMAATADLLGVNTKAVEQMVLPTEGQLENLVQFVQRQIVRNRYQPDNERTHFQQNNAEGKSLERRWLGHSGTSIKFGSQAAAEKRQAVLSA